MSAQIGFADALRRVFPTTVSGYSDFVLGSAKRSCTAEVQ